MNRREEGHYYEKMASDVLAENGFQILKRNIYTCVGELDILAKKGGVLYFFEVRFKKYLSAKESLTASKYRKMKRTMYYLIKRDGIKSPVKLGFIAIQYIQPGQIKLPWEEGDFESVDYICKILQYEGKKYRIEIFLSVFFD